MKEITRIHLAAIPYNVEIDTKKVLERYLHGVERSLDADEDAMREIEARIVEILTERGVTDEKVITEKDVEAIIGQLGDPKEFADEAELDEGRKQAGFAQRKLYRDVDQGMIAGVCSGVAAYFRIDATIVRLVAIALIFVTAGMMIPIYIVMALVTPPAKTAAQKLQMAGEPITLEALKERSLVDDTTNREMRSKILRFIGILVGAGLLVVAAGALAGLAALTWESYTYVFSSNSWWIIAGAVAFGVAGLLFVAMCLLLAYMAFTMKLTKRIGYTLIAIIVAGLLSLGVGMTGLKTIAPWSNNTAYYATSLETQTLKGVKKLQLEASQNVQVTYSAEDNKDSYSAEYWYANDAHTNNSPVSMKRDGDVLKLAVDERNCVNARWCGELVRVLIVGPQLEQIDVARQGVVTYRAGGQDTLTVRIADTGTVEVGSDKTIKTLNAELGKYGSLRAEEADVESVNLNVGGKDNAAMLASVKTATIRAPESCAATSLHSEVIMAGVQTILVNGRPYDEKNDYPCLNLVVAPQE